MYRIGELAQRFKIKTDTLRFYDKQGLLTPSSRSEAGYRMYTEGDAQRLRFILTAKGVGFSLTDIAELLCIELDKANRSCADVKEMVAIKLADIEVKLAELNYFKRSLQHLSDSCCGGPKSAEYCSILEALESNSPATQYANQTHNNGQSKE